MKLGWALTIVTFQDLEAISALENIAENSNNTIYLTKYWIVVYKPFYNEYLDNMFI